MYCDRHNMTNRRIIISGKIKSCNITAAVNIAWFSDWAAVSIVFDFFSRLFKTFHEVFQTWAISAWPTYDFMIAAFMFLVLLLFTTEPWSNTREFRYRKWCLHLTSDNWLIGTKHHILLDSFLSLVPFYLNCIWGGVQEGGLMVWLIQFTGWLPPEGEGQCFQNFGLRKTSSFLRVRSLIT